MSYDKSLLSFIAQRFPTTLEDIATDALFFILSRSASARRALSDFLSDDNHPLSIAKLSPKSLDAYGAIPDLACLDEDGNLLALIEVKFWAPLTPNQPVTYWKSLPADKPSVLLFLAPKPRIDDGYLWTGLVDRLGKAGHELGPADSDETRIAAPSKTDARRLMLTTWHSLLDSIAQQTEEDGDAQARFETAQLQGLVIDVITKGKPKRDEPLKRLIKDAVSRLVQSGWANTDGFAAGQGFGFFVRYLRIAGASAGLGIDYDIVKQRPDRILWLTFYPDKAASVSLESVRNVLGDLDEQGLKFRSTDISIHIPLPAEADHLETVNAIVLEMERIAKIIDPNGPTYLK